MLPEKAQNLFFILFVSVNLTDIALVQPIRIGINWLGVWKFCVGPQIVRTLELVRMRSKLLLLRSSGVVRDANRAVPCRISRYRIFCAHFSKTEMLNQELYVSYMILIKGVL